MRGELLIQMPGGAKVAIPKEPVDMVGANERASFFTKRSIKKQSKLDALYTIIRMIDLTTLEDEVKSLGYDYVREVCGKALAWSVDCEWTHAMSKKGILHSHNLSGHFENTSGALIERFHQTTCRLQTVIQK